MSSENNSRQYINDAQREIRNRRKREQTVDDFTRRARSRRKRTEDQMLLDDALAARCMHEGLFPGEIYKVVIADRYPEGQRVSRSAFIQQLERLRKCWREATKEDLDDVIGRTVAEIRNLKRAYWVGYYRSLGIDSRGNPITDPHAVVRGKRTQETSETLYDLTEFEKAKLEGKLPRPKDRKKIKVREDEEVGVKRWLDGVGWCIEMELKVRYGLKNLAAMNALSGRGGRNSSAGEERLSTETEQRALPAGGREYQPPSEDIMVEQMASLFQEMKMVAERRRLLAAAPDSATDRENCGESSCGNEGAVDAVFMDISLGEKA